MHDIFVQHNARQDTAALDLATGHLLHAGIPLDVDRAHARVVSRDDADGIERETAHKVRPADDELGPDRAFDECEHLRIVAGVDRDGDPGDDLESGLESLVVGGDDDDRMDVALELREGLGKNLPRYNEPRESDSCPRYPLVYG